MNVPFARIGLTLIQTKDLVGCQFAMFQGFKEDGVLFFRMWVYMCQSPLT